MKKFLWGLIIGAILTGAGVWYWNNQKNNATVREAKDRIETGAKDAKNAVEDKLNSWGLTPENIKDEVARTGAVIRNKAQQAGNAIADAATDTKITATIKGKLLADPDLSALSISVNTTGGVVTLSGTASSADNIGKAIKLALDTDGVTKVVSTLQVK